MISSLQLMGTLSLWILTAIIVSGRHTITQAVIFTGTGNLTTTLNGAWTWLLNVADKQNRSGDIYNGYFDHDGAATGRCKDFGDLEYFTGVWLG